MKTRFFILNALVLLAGLVSVSCRQEELPVKDNGGNIHSFTITTTSPMDEVVTRATDEIETTIQSMSIVLIGKEPGSTAKVVPAGEIGSHTAISSTNYKYSVTFDCEAYDIPAGDYYMYAVANDGKQFVSFDVNELNGKTKAEVDAAIAAKGNNDLDLADYVLMSGKYCEGSSTDGSCHLYGEGSTEAPDGVNNLTGTIHLRRIVSKITFNFEAKEGVEFKAETFGIFNYSRSSTLMERDGWSGADPGELDYAGNGNFRSAQGFAVLNNSFFFYAPENVQKNVPEVTSYRMREAHNTLTEDQAFQYAPENSTYVVVKGKYNDGTYSGDVTYTIHLGDFGHGNMGNFSIRRNYKYNYTIKVNSVNNIVAECIATDLTPEAEPQPGAEGYILKYNSQTVFNVDAHYEQVFIKFEKQEIDNYSVVANTPYSNGNQIDNGGDGESSVAPHAGWVQFGAPLSGSTFASYNPRLVTDVHTLISELRRNTDSDPTNDVANPHFLISTEGEGDAQKDYICIVGYVDEYFYEDHPVNTFVNADDRILTVALQTAMVSQDKHSTYMDGILFSIQQIPIRSVQNLSISNPFGVETVEEVAPMSNHILSSTPASGSNDASAWQNFVDLLRESGSVFPHVELGSTSWTSLVDVANNGHFSATQMGNSMVADYNYGFYQCIARNRDNNGNGKIDREEIEWYLPSSDQCSILYMGEAAMPTETRLSPVKVGTEIYFTSSPGERRMYWSEEGFSTSRYDGTWGNWQSYWREGAHTRCVRSLKSYDAPTTGLASNEGGVVTVHGLIDDPYVIRTSSINSELPPHVQRDAANSATYQFEVASADVTTGVSTSSTNLENITSHNFCADYTQDGDTRGGWRVPSLKELYLMISSGAVTRDYSYLTRTRNTVAGSDAVRYYAYNTSYGYIFAYNPGESISNLRVRCVRDYSNVKPQEKDEFMVSTTSISAARSDITSKFSVVAGDDVHWNIAVATTDGITLSATSGTGTKAITVYGGEPVAAGKSATFTVTTTSTNVNTSSYTIEYTQASTATTVPGTYSWAVDANRPLSGTSGTIVRNEVSWKQTNSNNVSSVSGPNLFTSSNSSSTVTLATSAFAGYKILSVKVTGFRGSQITSASVSVSVDNRPIGSSASLTQTSAMYQFDNDGNYSGDIIISIASTAANKNSATNRYVRITSIIVEYESTSAVVEPNVFHITYDLNSPMPGFDFSGIHAENRTITTYANSFVLTNEYLPHYGSDVAPSGLDFIGWYSDPVDGYLYEPGMTFEEDIILYAHWNLD